MTAELSSTEVLETSMDSLEHATEDLQSLTAAIGYTQLLGYKVETPMKCMQLPVYMLAMQPLSL